MTSTSRYDTWRSVILKTLFAAGCLLALLALLEWVIPTSQTVTYCGRGGDAVILTSNGEYWLTADSVDEVPKTTGVVIRVTGARINLLGWHGYQAHVESIAVVSGATPQSCPSR